MKLEFLLKELFPLEVIGSVEVEVTGVQGDSRHVSRGNLFVAVRGDKMDGHAFIRSAVKSGATAIVVEEIQMELSEVTQIRVADSRLALALASAVWNRHPSRSLKVIGITGTNGKTTTSHLVASILEAAGWPAGIIGTLYYRIGRRELSASNTTPPADVLQTLLRQMFEEGMKAVTMEVSSHALEQHRVEGVEWEGGVFTNLTQDHLDYHQTMGAYAEAKKILFRHLGRGTKKSFSILNRDDAHWEAFRDATTKGVRVLTYGFHESSDIRAVGISSSVDGCRFTLVTGCGEIGISSSLCGDHNVSNCLAAAATGVALGLSLEIIREGIAAVRNVPGRLERVISSAPFAIFVDYAHTEDALRHVLKTLRPLAHGRLITVFGCGGDRDRLKRPRMGRVAAELSDFSVVTTDNPRFEEPERIMEEIRVGFGNRQNFQLTQDRRKAIRSALGMAARGDVILLAGKGHETYQETHGVRVPFDDRAVAREELIAMMKQKGEESWN